MNIINFFNVNINLVSFSGCLSFGFISSNKLLPSGDHGVLLKYSLFGILIYLLFFNKLSSNKGIKKLDIISSSYFIDSRVAS